MKRFSNRITAVSSGIRTRDILIEELEKIKINERRNLSFQLVEHVTSRAVGIKKEKEASHDSPITMETDDTEDDKMILNATSEFCRTLGDIPTYGLAGNRTEERDELLVSTDYSQTSV